MEERSVLIVVGELAGELNEFSDKTIISSVLGGTTGAGSEYKGDPADVSHWTFSLSSNLDDSGGVVGGTKSDPLGSSNSLGTPWSVPSSLLLSWFTTAGIDS